MVVFKDRYASRGKPKLLSEKTTIPATSPSRSLDSLIRPDNKIIKIEIRDNGYLIIDFSTVVGDKAKISMTNAKRFAKYILEVYARRPLKTNPTNLARKS